MIVPMLKYSFIVHHAGYDTFLSDIKKIGVLHVIESKREPTTLMQQNFYQIAEVTKTIKTLERIDTSNVDNFENLPATGQQLLELIKNYQLNIEKLAQQATVLDKEYKLLLPWGDFSWEAIKKLNDSGLKVCFFRCSTRKFDENWRNKFNIEVISEEGASIYFVLIVENNQPIPDIDADTVELPELSLMFVAENIEKIKNQQTKANIELAQIAKNGLPLLQLYLSELNNKIADEKVQLHTNSEAEGSVKVLEGWVPVINSAELEKYLETNNYLFINEKPAETDNPPVLLKNNKFSRLFEVIGNLYSLPNYRELDLTPYLAPFYLLFFGFCFSDAGYGLLFFSVASLIKFKQDKPSPILSLVQLLGASTMLFGLLGGTFFGIELYKTNLPFYSSIAQAYGSVDNPIDKIIQDIMFKASLALGLVQMLFGMFLRAVKLTRQKGFIHAVSTLGWAFLIVFSVINYFVAGSVNFLNIAYIVAASVCLFGIFFMNSPGKNPLINFGAGLWDTYNTVVGGVGDLLSYVRLFALGLASAILGLVFNNLGLKLFNPEAGIVMQIVGFVLMLAVLVIGHAINIFMSGLGSMVHPLRLTFVEFYKNAGFEGGGKPYNPFRKE